MPLLRLAVVSCAALLAVSAVPVSRSGQVAARDAGTIRGRVSLAEPPAPAERRPAIGDIGAGTQLNVDRRRAVVYLKSAPLEAFDVVRPGHARMDQRNEQFVPRVLAITSGTTVDFPNSDTKFHNVFSFSKAHPFDLGLYPPGHSGAVRFDEAGIVQVFCDIHSHMRGYIFVFSHPFFAVTDDDGRYTIPGVPGGSYTLLVWSELGRTEPKRISVTDNAVTDADFQVIRLP
jgi:plastocyanin